MTGMMKQYGNHILRLENQYAASRGLVSFFVMYPGQLVEAMEVVLRKNILNADQAVTSKIRSALDNISARAES